MNTPTPTGRLMATPDGHDLLLTRALPVSLKDAWVGITDPERTSRWIGRWEGTGAVGETVRLQLGFEDDSPWADVRIAACEAPQRLRILINDESGSWDISLDLIGTEERTELRFVMHLIDLSAVGEIGPGWEYYLDQLVAFSNDAPLPNFDDYFPSQRNYFEAQARRELT